MHACVRACSAVRCGAVRCGAVCCAVLCCAVCVLRGARAPKLGDVWRGRDRGLGMGATKQAVHIHAIAAYEPLFHAIPNAAERVTAAEPGGGATWEVEPLRQAHGTSCCAGLELRGGEGQTDDA